VQRFFHQENYKFVLKFASSPALKLQKRNQVSDSKSKVVNERLLQQKFSPFLRIALKIFFSIYYLIMKAKRSLLLPYHDTTIITTKKWQKRTNNFAKAVWQT